jgi:hypothetical protein
VRWSATPVRSSLLARAGTYLTSKGVRPEDDPRRPALHGLGLDGNAMVIIAQVMKALKDAGYSEAERRTYYTFATLGGRAKFLAVTHQWCSLTGGAYTITVRNDDCEEVEVEVFVCGLCGHEERAEQSIRDECMGCGFCHDCCDCE